MTFIHFIIKVKNYLRECFIARIKNEPYERYCLFYKSYRHSLIHNAIPVFQNYMAAVPNRGAGIGHQMANWMAGYHYSKLFSLKFAHIPFADRAYPYEPSKWESFLGFYQNEILYQDLVKEGYKVVRLPFFDGNKYEQVEIIKKIIHSYSDEKVIFLCEQDQFYKDLQTLIPILQRKFYSEPCREEDSLIYDKNCFNVAIHVRRGDIMCDPSNQNLTMRYLSNDYFYKVLRKVLDKLRTETKEVHIYFFSQGTPEDFPEFKKIPNIHWCMEMDAQNSFLHMAYADLLITSKSSFSYKPALLNRGLKLCPLNFWHGYPDSPDWIMVDNNGTIIEK